MSKSNPSNVAVPVSYNLQLATVVASLIAGFVELSAFLKMALASGGSISSAFMVQGFAVSLFPLLLLITAFVLSPGYSNAVSRTFIALVKTVLFIAIYGAITVIYSNVLTNYYQPLSIEGSSFWYSSSVQYAFMTAVWVSLIVTHYVKGPSKN